jgi:hypothetical protein
VPANLRFAGDQQILPGSLVVLHRDCWSTPGSANPGQVVAYAALKPLAICLGTSTFERSGRPHTAASATAESWSLVLVGDRVGWVNADASVEPPGMERA